MSNGVQDDNEAQMMIGSHTLSRLAAALEASEGRARLSQELWTRLPAYVREHGNAASATTIQLQPLTSQPFLVESIVVSTPDAATLYLAEVQLFFPASGIYTLAPVAFLLLPGDLRELVALTAGAIQLTLSGHQSPQFGVFR